MPRHPKPRGVASARELKRPGRPSNVTTEATKGSMGRSKRTLTLSLGTRDGVGYLGQAHTTGHTVLFFVMGRWKLGGAKKLGFTRVAVFVTTLEAAI